MSDKKENGSRNKIWTAIFVNKDLAEMKFNLIQSYTLENYTTALNPKAAHPVTAG